MNLYKSMQNQYKSMQTNLRRASFAEKKRLRQPGKPHQAYNVSDKLRNGRFCRKKARLWQPGRPHQAYKI